MAQVTSAGSPAAHGSRSRLGGCVAASACALCLVACGGGGQGTGGSSTSASNPAPLAFGNPTAAATGAVPAPASNVLRVHLDRGMRGTAFNTPYVSVTLCVPGGSICRDIDHVMVDTASWGLRLAASAIPPEMGLPAVRTANGVLVGQCVQFASGYAWGSVRLADVRLSGQQVANLPVQVIGDSDPALANAPSACSSPGSDLGSRLDANGVLGVGMLRYDCGPACTTSTAPGIYFACDGHACMSATLALHQQVVNPVAMLATHNNGVAVVLQQVPAGGASMLEGALILGIGTSDNNQLGTAQVLAMDSHYQLTTVYKGRSYPSTVDSGANALFFPDTDLPACAGLYCPPQPTTLQAQLQSHSGARRDVTVALEALGTLGPDAVAGSIGQNEADSVTWGLPFFFGRTVFVALKDSPTPGGPGPYWAF